MANAFKLIYYEESYPWLVPISKEVIEVYVDLF